MPSLNEYKIDPNKVFLSSDLRPKQVKLKDGQLLIQVKHLLLGLIVQQDQSFISYQMADNLK